MHSTFAIGIDKGMHAGNALRTVDTGPTFQVFDETRLAFVYAQTTGLIGNCLVLFGTIASSIVQQKNYILYHPLTKIC